MKKILCQTTKITELVNREVDILRQLPEHKNIVQFHQSALIDSTQNPNVKECIILLELCPNGTLLDWVYGRMAELEAKNQLYIPEVEIKKPFCDVAEAIYFLHSIKPPMVHQDLKAENVLLGIALYSYLSIYS
jgi:AP2-associated kinase